MYTNDPLLIGSERWANLEDLKPILELCYLGRHGLDEAKQRLGLAPLAERRRRRRIELLMAIISNESSHPALSASYDELVGHQSISGQVQTRSQSRGQPRSLRTNTNPYHQSFLPRTIRDMKIAQL